MHTNKILRNLFQRRALQRCMPARTYKPIQTSTVNTTLAESETDISYANELSKHRAILPLYELNLVIQDNYIAPSATIVGEVNIDCYSTVWNNAVIRGEINLVTIGPYVSIGDNTVIQTVASLPTGLPARVFIGSNVTIHSDCSLSSCHIEEDVVIGAKSVI